LTNKTQHWFSYF